MAVQLVRTELRQPLVMQGYWEFAMKFAMEHFQTKKPRDKARREFRRWRMSPAGQSRARAIGRFREKPGSKMRITFNRKNLHIGQICGILVVDKRPRLVESQVSGFSISLCRSINLAKILRKAWFMEIRMRRPHSLTHGQLSQLCGVLPHISFMGHSLQFSQATQ